MKLTTLLIALTLTLAAHPASAQEEYKGNKKDQYDARGVREFDIRLDSGFDIQIRGKDTQNISYTYHFEGNQLAYERNFIQADIEFEKHGSRAVISIDFPDLKNIGQNWVQQLLDTGKAELNATRQELILDVPQDLELRLSTRYSDVDISNIQRRTHIETRSGAVSADNIGGNLEIANEYGNSTIENIGGKLSLHSRSATIMAQNIAGETSINSSYSNLTLVDCESDVQINNRSGEIDIRGINGDARIESDYTKIKLMNISGKTNVTSQNGQVTAKQLPSLTVRGEYTDVEASEINGTEGVHIDGRSSNINVSTIRGPVNISGSYLEIRLNELNENLRISNQSGSVDASSVYGDVEFSGEYTEFDLNNYLGHRLQISNSSGDVNITAQKVLSEVTINTRYSDVRLEMKEPYQGRVYFEAMYGEIDTNLQITDLKEHSNEITERQIKILEGRVGEGTGTLSITAQSGNIVVTQE